MEEDPIYYELKARVKACSRVILNEPDWAANMELIDMINAHPHYCVHISRALKKRIRHWNPNVGLLAVQLAEAIVKNCPSFHSFAADPDFLDAMLKEVYRKKDKKTFLQHVGLQEQKISDVSKMQRRDKILLLIECWGRDFKNSSKFQIFRITYEDLLRQGFQFPAPLKDEVSPVFTPAAKPKVRPESDSSGPIKDADLQNTLSTIELYMDTLNESDATTNLRTDDAIVALSSTLKSHQNSIIDRISSDPSEELLQELLIVNDEICQAQIFFDALLAGKVERRQKSPVKRGKGQRVSVVQVPAYQADDILGFGAPALVQIPESARHANANDESSDDEEDSDNDANDDFRSAHEHQVAIIESEQKKEQQLVVASKGLAAPRSNVKSRGRAVVVQNNDINNPFMASSPSQGAPASDPFATSPKVFDAMTSPSLKPEMNPADKADEFLAMTLRSTNPNSNAAKPVPKKTTDLKMFGPI